MSDWWDDDSGDSGPGLGVGMLLGGALTWLFAGGRTEYGLPDDEEYEDLGVLTKEERSFLSQLWRLEFQIEEAMKEEDWEQALILINAFNGAIENIWKPFVPGTDEFKPSPKYLHEIEDLIGPSFKSIEASINLDPFSKLSPERMRELTGKQLSIDLDKWEFVSGKEVRSQLRVHSSFFPMACRSEFLPFASCPSSQIITPPYPSLIACAVFLRIVAGPLK